MTNRRRCNDLSPLTFSLTLKLIRRWWIPCKNAIETEKVNQKLFSLDFLFSDRNWSNMNDENERGKKTRVNNDDPSWNNFKSSENKTKRKYKINECYLNTHTTSAIYFFSVCCEWSEDTNWSIGGHLRMFPLTENFEFTYCGALTTLTAVSMYMLQASFLISFSPVLLPLVDYFLSFFAHFFDCRLFYFNDFGIRNQFEKSRMKNNNENPKTYH